MANEIERTVEQDMRAAEQCWFLATGKGITDTSAAMYAVMFNINIDGNTVTVDGKPEYTVAEVNGVVTVAAINAAKPDEHEPIEVEPVKVEHGNDPLEGKTYCITGRLAHMNKGEAYALGSKHGAHALDDVKKDMDFLVQADDRNTKGNSAKYQKALKYNIPIISEEEFIDLLAWEPKSEPAPEPKPEPEPKPKPVKRTRKSEPKSEPKPKGKDDGTWNGMTWEERVAVGKKIAAESNGRLVFEWKGKNVETAWAWLRPAEEGCDAFTKQERRLLKRNGGAGWRYKKYGEGTQYEPGTAMWYLPYPNTMRFHKGSGHKQYKTIEENEEELVS